MNLNYFIAAQSNGMIAAGQIVQSTTAAIPGYLLCDGSEVDKIRFSELYEIVGNQFGITSSTNTFRLPNLNAKLIKDFCVICKRTDHDLDITLQYRGLKFDHPFLKNNLEYLEWRSLQTK